MDLRMLAGGVVMTAGAVFLFLGALGIVRMPDLYNRMQAGTKATTLGNILTLGGLGIMRPDWLPKIGLIALFVLLTNPISSHALARAAHRCGMPLAAGSVRDDLLSRSPDVGTDGCSTLDEVEGPRGSAGDGAGAAGRSR